jgi:acetyl-CoA carboxylase carboxyltransferase component
MGNVDDKIKDLKDREAKILEMGGDKPLPNTKKKANYRPGTAGVSCLMPVPFARSTCLSVTAASISAWRRWTIPSDGVVTGHGMVDGRPVFAFAQDFTARAGSLGEMHAKKICKVMDLAVKAGVPFVGLNDSGGARIQEGVDALSGYGQIFYRNSAASGVIPRFRPSWGPPPAAPSTLRP